MGPGGTPRRRPARPVAETAQIDVQSLASRIAKGWLLELLDSEPLANATSVPVERLSAEGPPLCEALLRSLARDDDLARLDAGGSLAQLAASAGAIAGAGDAPATAQAMEALRAVTWATLEESLGPLEGRLAAELGERLSRACAVVGAGALRALEGSDAPPASAPLDELARVRAQRADEDADWIEALEAQMGEGRRFALLLVELDGLERLQASLAPAQRRRIFDRVARAARHGVRRADLIAHEEEGRLWVVAPEAGRVGAGALAQRVAGALGEVAGSHGTSLTASVGVALFPEDGRDVESLTAQAEEGLYAARAAGLPVEEDAPGVTPGPWLAR